MRQRYLEVEDVRYEVPTLKVLRHSVNMPLWKGDLCLLPASCFQACFWCCLMLISIAVTFMLEAVLGTSWLHRLILMYFLIVTLGKLKCCQWLKYWWSLTDPYRDMTLLKKSDSVCCSSCTYLICLLLELLKKSPSMLRIWGFEMRHVVCQQHGLTFSCKHQFLGLFTQNRNSITCKKVFFHVSKAAWYIGSG